MLFILLVFLTAMMMEGIGSYISVIGLNSIFAGNIVILAMAVILDVAKIVTVSIVYKHWSRLSKIALGYMISAVLVTMLITSSGAFGYLSSSFQQAILPNKEVVIKLEALQAEKVKLEAVKADLLVRKKDIANQIANLPSNVVRGRQKLIDSFRPDTKYIQSEMVKVDTRMSAIDVELPALQNKNLDTQSHVGPIAYVSEAFGVSMTTAIKYVIFVIIFVFDPLAVMLVISGNFLINVRKEELEKKRLEKLEREQEDKRLLREQELDEVHHRHEIETERLKIEQEKIELARKTEDHKFTIAEEVLDKVPELTKEEEEWIDACVPSDWTSPKYYDNGDKSLEAWRNWGFDQDILTEAEVDALLKGVTGTDYVDDNNEEICYRITNDKVDDKVEEVIIDDNIEPTSEQVDSTIITDDKIFTEEEVAAIVGALENTHGEIDDKPTQDDVVSLPIEEPLAEVVYSEEELQDLPVTDEEYELYMLGNDDIDDGIPPNLDEPEPTVSDETQLESILHEEEHEHVVIEQLPIEEIQVVIEEPVVKDEPVLNRILSRNLHKEVKAPVIEENTDLERPESVLTDLVPHPIHSKVEFVPDHETDSKINQRLFSYYSQGDVTNHKK
jgi:hypothetical protein